MSQTIDVFSGEVIKKPPHVKSVYPMFYQQTHNEPRKLFEPIDQHPDFESTKKLEYIRGFSTGWNSGHISVLKRGDPESKRRYFKDQTAVTTYLAPHSDIAKTTKNWFHTRKFSDSKTTVTSNVKGRDAKYEIRISQQNQGKLFAP